MKGGNNVGRWHGHAAHDRPRPGEAVKKQTVSRKGAKTQSSSALFAQRHFAPWRLCVRCFSVESIFSHFREISQRSNQPPQSRGTSRWIHEERFL